MYDVYNDSKRGTLSAWSWPSRCMARNAACATESLNGEFLSYTPSLFDAQYTNPVHHRECLNCIADCGKEDLVKNLDQALAIAVKVDGHVDAYQTENKTVAVSYISKKGDLVTSFVSSEKPIERGARGMLGAIQNAFNCIGWSWEDNAKKKICGITTDGESANTGSKRGLWTLLQQQCELHLLTFWCACHRASLAFKSVRNTITEVDCLLTEVISVCTFFRTSGIRCAELETTGKLLNPPIEVHHWPQFKEVRMVEFTVQILRSFSINLRACLVYWQNLVDTGEDAQERCKAKGFLSNWLNKDKLHLLFVMLDIAEILTRLQLKFQSNQLTLLQIPQCKEIAITHLSQLSSSPKIGGWEELYLKNVSTNAEESTFFSHKLQNNSRRTHSAHIFVSTPHDFNAIRNEVIIATKNFLQERLESNDLMVLASIFDPTAIQSAIESNRTQFLEKYGNEQIKEICQSFMPDLELSEVASDWIEIKSAITAIDLIECSFLTLLKKLCLLTNKTMLSASMGLTLISRVAALSPHNMFVERCISCYDLMKDDDRSSLSRETVNDYLMVKINMPPLINFDMRRAVLKYLNKKERHPHRVNMSKYKSQHWFSGVFEEADERQPPKKLTTKDVMN